MSNRERLARGMEETHRLLEAGTTVAGLKEKELGELLASEARKVALAKWCGKRQRFRKAGSPKD